MNTDELFSEKHTAGILTALGECGGRLTKNDLYGKVSYNPRMVTKLDIMESAGLVTLERDINDNGNPACFVTLTWKGDKIAALLECIDKVLASDGVVC